MLLEKQLTLPHCLGKIILFLILMSRYQVKIINLNSLKNTGPWTAELSWGVEIQMQSLATN